MPVNFENLLANSVIRSAFLESWSCENCSKIGNDSIYIMQHCDHGVCVSCLDRAQLKGMINTGEKSHFFPCPVDACSRKFSILERDLNFMGNAIMSPPWFRVTMENQLKTIDFSYAAKRFQEIFDSPSRKLSEDDLKGIWTQYTNQYEDWNIGTFSRFERDYLLVALKTFKKFRNFWDTDNQFLYGFLTTADAEELIKKTFKLIPTEKDSSQRVVLRVGSQPQTITATYIEKSGNVSHFLFPENVKEIDLTAYGWDTIVRSDRMFKVRGSEQKQQGKHYFTHTQLFKLY